MQQESLPIMTLNSKTPKKIDIYQPPNALQLEKTPTRVTEINPKNEYLNMKSNIVVNKKFKELILPLDIKKLEKLSDSIDEYHDQTKDLDQVKAAGRLHLQLLVQFGRRKNSKK